jgi:hypothetical protein
MRSTHLPGLMLAALLLLSAGCSSNNKGHIEDTKWASLATTVKGESLAAGARYLEFKKDGKMVYTLNSQPCNGTYTLGLGPTVTFNLEKEVDGRKIHPQKIVIDGNRLIMTDPDGSEVTFQRIQ